MQTRGRIVAVLAGLAVLVLASAIFLTSSSRDNVSTIERIFQDALSPALSAVSTVSRAVSGAWDSALSLRDAYGENARLREEVARLRQENAQLQEAARQNEQLRAALMLGEMRVGDTVAAEVIARPLNNWWNVLTINKGERHGVQARMGVVAPEGVVGHVRHATAWTAEVVLLTDPRSAVGGLVRRTGQPVLVEGLGFPGTKLRLRPLDEGVDIQVGDEIITAGVSQFFNKGIPIGTVTEVELGPFGLSVEAVVEPFVEFGRIEYVTVLTDAVRMEGPDEAQPADEPAEAGLDQSDSSGR